MKTNLKFLKSTSSEAESRPVVVFIPGGPCLSSKTLSGLEVLNRSFDVVFLDPPGTGGLPDIEKQDFNSVLGSMETELKSLRRPIILAGHSFGGYQAAKLVEINQTRYVGLICLATPFLDETYSGLVEQYTKYMTAELRATEEKWTQNKTVESMRDWLASYGALYFTEETIAQGKKLLLEDKMSLQAFLGMSTAVKDQEKLLKFLEASPIKKLFLAGEKDNLIPPSLLEKDARTGGFEFHILKDAAHFINLNQSETVARLIENKFIDSKRGREP